MDMKEFAPVSELAKIKGITNEEVIKRVRDGFYIGKVVDGVWYIHKSELGEETVPKKEQAPIKSTEPSIKSDPIPEEVVQPERKNSTSKRLLEYKNLLFAALALNAVISLAGLYFSYQAMNEA